MKKSILLVIVALFYHSVYAQSGMWTWIKGSNTVNNPGVSGTMGIPDVDDNPEARYQAAHWIDLNGNLWIFGGLNINHEVLNNLWRYNPNTNIWTWMKGPLTPNGTGVYGTQGIPSPNNNPSARGYGSTAWTDKQGRLWLRGGYGYNALGILTNLDDMWMYDIPSNQWTWMKGSNTGSIAPNYGTLQVESAATTPGSLDEINTAWVKSDGTLWSSGGRSSSGDISIDMWKFDIATNNWTWMKGGGLNTNGNYGSLNVESSTNIPPARWSYTSWQDKDDNFYIFGGAPYSAAGRFNDTWRFNTTTNNWTWISGSNQISDPGNYTYQCSSSVDVYPLARMENRSAKTLGCLEDFWTFGGFGGASLNDDDYPYNDFWNFNPSTNEWTWVSGDTTADNPGNYGVLNVPSPLNEPPARGGACLWALPNGEIRLWGGMKSDAEKFNDMWSYVPDTACAGKCIYITNSTSTPIFAIPNAFTPDGNGANDIFYPAHYNSSKGEIKTFHVYNRWGELIYSNPAQGWDGTYKGEPQPAGTYMYTFFFTIPDAQSPSGTKEIKKIGSFSLLR